MEYPSRTIEQAVYELSRLPGIGRKTALRLAMHLLKRPLEESQSLSNALFALRANTCYCKECYNISDDTVCQLCLSTRRDRTLICVVEDTRDVMALENTHQYNGLYHVLGGIINPMEGIGPDQLKIDTLLSRIENKEVKELIFAFSASMEGETTAFYISRKIKREDLRITSIAKGIPVGSELEYADEITLARSLLNRIQYSTKSNLQ